MKTQEHFVPLIRTKLHRPPVTDDCVWRDRLIDLMNSNRAAPLILVSAPAGYGKSVLVSQWCERSGEAVAWLSLGPDDSEPRTFLEYLMAAVDTVSPDACSATRELLSSPELPPVAVLTRYLTNDLDALDTSCTIVLDDYHSIDRKSPVHSLLEGVIEHPPQQIRIVLVTRRNPPIALSGMRGGHQINELGLRDLRFTRPETAALLATRLKLSIGEKALSNLHNEIEGWAVGLQLAILALRNAVDPDTYLVELKGGLPHAQEYLMHEVLRALSPEVREFLLASSILDRFCAEALGAIIETAKPAPRPELSAHSFLEQIRTGGFFTIPLDTENTWFRYHHLFREVLRDELMKSTSPDEITDLHLRVSAWFESQGLIDESIKHALKAQDTALAAEIFERHWRAEQDRERWRVVERWLTMLPIEVAEQRPGTLLARAWMNHYRFDLKSLSTTIDRLEKLPDSGAVDGMVSGEINLFRGVLHFWAGQLEPARDLLLDAQDRFPPTLAPAAGLTQIYLGFTHQMLGQGREVLQSIDRRIRDFGHQSDRYKANLETACAFVHLLSGELPRAAISARRVTSYAEQYGGRYLVSFGKYLEGATHFQSYDLAATMACFARLYGLRHSMHSRAAVDAMVGLALTQQALRRPAAAGETIDGLLSLAEESQAPILLSVARSGQARLALAQGKIEPAVRWLRSFDQRSSGSDLLCWLEQPTITSARVLIAIGSDESLRDATELLEKLRLVTEELHNTCQTIDILALQSLALEKWAHPDEALAVLEQALTLAQPGGWIRPFVEPGPVMAELLERLSKGSGHDMYLDRILAAFGDAGHTPVGAEAETVGPSRPGLREQGVVPRAPFADLTKRELEVLELLAQRLQNKEIAQRLFISTQTVITHLKHIYRKLKVGNRRQAVIRAVETGILGRQSSG